MTPEELQELVKRLCALTRETEWVEFKQNNTDPQEIGANISALSNGAALHQQPRAFLLWGIDNGATHARLGTTFSPRQTKKGNEELESWLHRLLSPPIEFRIYELQIEEKNLVLLEIYPASHQPVSFAGIEYIRVGTYTKKLKDFPEKERALWAYFSKKPFESGVALVGASSDDTLALLDYTNAFHLLGIRLPDERQGIFQRLVGEKAIISRPGGRFDITNVGAILFANDLRRFDGLARKAPRVVIYRGEDRTKTIREQDGARGYAIGFAGLISFINDQLPQNEEIGQALRNKVKLYPEIAIRELVANALIHQDFHLTGTGPMVEVFANRMEISNPGAPLINPLRFIDEPPRSRNEALAGLMRRMNVCEERGSGIDKVIFQVEAFQLPAPEFRATIDHTVVVLFGRRSFSEMGRDDRIRACYQHACLLYVSGKHMTNTTLRNRLRIEKRNYPMASRIIRDAIDKKLIRQAGGTRKDAGYVPFWA